MSFKYDDIDIYLDRGAAIGGKLVIVVVICFLAFCGMIGLVATGRELLQEAGLVRYHCEKTATETVCHYPHSEAGQ